MTNQEKLYIELKNKAEEIFSHNAFSLSDDAYTPG